MSRALFIVSGFVMLLLHEAEQVLVSWIHHNRWQSALE